MDEHIIHSIHTMLLAGLVNAYVIHTILAFSEEQFKNWFNRHPLIHHRVAQLGATLFLVPAVYYAVDLINVA